MQVECTDRSKKHQYVFYNRIEKANQFLKIFSRFRQVNTYNIFSIYKSDISIYLYKCCHAKLDKLKNQVFLCPLFLFLSHTFQTHMCEKDLNHVFKNKYKNTSIALPKSCIHSTLYRVRYMQVFMHFLYSEKTWRYLVLVQIYITLVHIGNNIYLLD